MLGIRAVYVCHICSRRGTKRHRGMDPRSVPPAELLLHLFAANVRILTTLLQVHSRESIVIIERKAVGEARTS